MDCIILGSWCDSQELTNTCLLHPFSSSDLKTYALK